MTMTLYDKSTENDDDGIVLNVFLPEAEMPQVTAADVVLVRLGKVCFVSPRSCIHHLSASNLV